VHKTLNFHSPGRHLCLLSPNFHWGTLIALLEVSREKVRGQFILVLVESELHSRITTP
jgi:hypothetical protein